jgi:aspartate racemase
LPDDEDRRQVQDLIFHLKRNGSPDSARSLLDRFAEKYGARHFICGCTEMHLLAKYFQSSPDPEPRYTFLDPLMVIAKSLTHD